MTAEIGARRPRRPVVTRWRPAGRSAGRVGQMEEFAERCDRRAIAPPGRGSVADDQRGAGRFGGGVADVVAAEPVEREPGKCPLGDDLVLIRPGAGRRTRTPRRAPRPARGASRRPRPGGGSWTGRRDRAAGHGAAAGTSCGSVGAGPVRSGPGGRESPVRNWSRKVLPHCGYTLDHCGPRARGATADLAARDVTGRRATWSQG